MATHSEADFPETVEGDIAAKETEDQASAEVAQTLPPFKSEARGTVGNPDDGQRRPHLENGATEPLGNIPLEDGDAPQAGPDPLSMATQGLLNSKGAASQGSGAPHLTVEQIEQDIQQAFEGDKSAIIIWSRTARDTTAALQAALENAGINDQEKVDEVRDLLAFQADVLDHVQRLVEEGQKKEAARRFRELLSRLGKAGLEFMEQPGVLAGLVSCATLCALGLCGAFSPVPATLIVAAITRPGKTTLKLLEKLAERHD